MSYSISDARRSADFGSRNPVETRWRRPLMRFTKYQIPTRFTKAISQPLGHPAIQRDAVEVDAASVADEWHLPPRDAVVDRVAAHREIGRRRIDVEPARLERVVLVLRNVLGFHGALLTVVRGVVERGRDVPLRGTSPAMVGSRPRSATRDDALASVGRELRFSVRLARNRARVGDVRSSEPCDAGTRRMVGSRCYRRRGPAVRRRVALATDGESPGIAVKSAAAGHRFYHRAVPEQARGSLLRLDLSIVTDRRSRRRG